MSLNRLFTPIILSLLTLFLAVGFLLPLATILVKSTYSGDGTFVGIENFRKFIGTPGLAAAISNSLTTSVISTVITVTLGFIFAYGLKRTRMPGRPLLSGAAMIPILAPSLLPGIALIYLFGKQGVLRDLLMGHSIYGPIGIVIGQVIFGLPHAVLMLSTALAAADQRLYEAAISLRARPIRIFLTVTLPACRYGIAGAVLSAFTTSFTDFGVPSVVGGNYPVLSTQVYIQVVGQFDFQMGAVTAIFLLLPTMLSFILQQVIARRHVEPISSGAIPLQVAPHPVRDTVFFLICATVALFLLAVIGMAVFGSFVKFWPYDLSLSFNNYDFSRMPGGGWGVYANSWILALSTACTGTIVIFAGAYLIEKSDGSAWLRATANFICMLPLAVPGIVLGLSYIFFFNNPDNPLVGLYGTMGILVLSCVIYYYTVPHIMSLTALKHLSREFELTGASLKVPFYVTFFRVTLPCCLPTIVNIWGYLFVNAMTTVAAVIFLYTANTQIAAITIVSWQSSGKVAAAAAMSMVILMTSASIWALCSWGSHRLSGRLHLA
ncbi:putative 2-aminoethylphosphonate ABC transporter permease subunit [Agrobacterium tumefaciens]|uniref:putative 2-aminoethylphosphonate ABC transporter permease subunit n=1 Tax=Agrobacterium tumefaciens TaxID=358 RepID=UPI00157207C5|nr:putative 2-aminoethylphosphonate ABC transporter permease subunit [Agrobacterium tumefaciens]NTE65531.1 putative 2-aminoethylphosphonate ABC transporter permease subunit [Agrobacterium tumefaciens]